MRIVTSAAEPLDFCLDCAPNDGEARELYGGVGDGPDGRGSCFDFDAAHPLYGSWTYRCCACGRQLGDED